MGEGLGAISKINDFVERIERPLSNPVLFYTGFAIWLTNAILATTSFWLFVPGGVSKLLRYASLLTLAIWSLAHSRSKISVIPAFIAAALCAYVLAGSSKAVRYALALIAPLGELCGKEGPRSTGSWARLLAAYLLLVISVKADSVWLLDLSMIILVAAEADIDKAMKLALILTVVFVSATFTGVSLGVIHDFVLEAGVTTRMRHYLGFGYALYPSRYLFLITCLVVYLEGNKLGIAETILLLAANGAVYKLTDSRLACYCSVMVLVGSLLIVHTPLRRILDFKATRGLAVALVPICACVAVALAAYYDPNVEWMEKLNATGVLSGRLRLGHDAIKTMGVPLLGQKINFIGNGLASLSSPTPTGAYNYVDSIYVQLLVNFGPIVWMLYVGLQMAVVLAAARDRNVPLTMILLLIVAQGIIDDASLSLQYNTFLLLVAPLVSSGSLNALLPYPHAKETQDV